MSSKSIIAFDLYGTLLSTSSISTGLARRFGSEKAQSVATLWRTLQLEYTWRLNSMGRYEPFSTVTRKALQDALAEQQLSASAQDAEELMRAYDSLGAFPDVGPALDALGGDDSVRAVVFSNGTDAMVRSSVGSSPDLAPYASVLRDLITVEEVQKFKPAPEVYYHLAQRVGKTREQISEIWLVSGNPFDVVGARAVGMQSIWVDRSRKGWTDMLGERPTAVVSGLGEVVEIVQRHAEKRSIS